MRLAERISEAARDVRLHRVRSLLTASGFAAGTAAAVVLFAVTAGARSAILGQIEALGIDLVSVRPVGEPKRDRPPPLAFGDGETLARSLPFVRGVAPVRRLVAPVMLPTERVTVDVVGTDAAFFRLRRHDLARGRVFTDEEAARGERVCVLGAGAARELFPSRAAYGSLVKVGGNWYRVVGVLRSEPSDLGDASGDRRGSGREVYLPIRNTFASPATARQAVDELWVGIDRATAPETAARVLERSLGRRHDGAGRLDVATAAELLARHRRARTLLDALLLAVCVAAFAAGGLATAALSWQNVRQRTREIAIRRAVGATRGDVLAQFVLEGLVIAAAGAAAGLAAGLAGSAVASLLGGWPWVVPAAAPVLATAAALAVGGAAALLPAAWAARLDPVAALGFER